MASSDILRIGVSSCILYPDSERPYFGPKYLNYIERDMARYLSSMNALPLLIPDLADELLDIFFTDLDALVLQGGSDISPEMYGEEGILDNRWPGDKYRDLYEIKLIKRALAQGIPIFGICRGFQLLNVYFNGSLYQDFKSQHETKLEHRNAVAYDKILHAVEISDGGILGDIYPQLKDKQLMVNSVHHQGIKALGDEFKVEALSAGDGIIEAFSRMEDGKSLILGVQWHPEFLHTLGNKVSDGAPLYQWFLSNVLKFKKKR